MNKTETIILFQQILQKLEKLEKKQNETYQATTEIGTAMLENQAKIWKKIIELKEIK